MLYIIQSSSLALHSTRLELIHRHFPNSATPIDQLELIKKLVHIDIARQKMITYRRHLSQSQLTIPRRETWEKAGKAVEMPIFAARDYGTGLYFAKFKVGTPFQKFKLVVDTGSDLTWLDCKYKCRGGGRHCLKKNNGVFKADLSSSFKVVPCSTSMCKIDLMNLFSLTTCPTPHTPCRYDYRYFDGSSTLGIFANETVTVDLVRGKKTKIRNVLVGCSNSFQSSSFNNADGVLGLAFSNYSFTSKATKKFGGKFSYCLVDHLSHKNVSNYLIFGPNSHNKKQPLLGNVRYTKLELGLISPFYAVNVKVVSIDGVMLKIPSRVWDANLGGGTILDSGTSLTYLTEDAYEPVIATLGSALTKFKRVDLDGIPMKFCFNSTGFDAESMPRLIFHFVDGARFEPHVKSYVIDVAPQIKCLGFISVSWPGTNILGNIIQQNYLWEFDLVRSKLGFAPSTCI
ncbi:hypothetical protein ACFE04_023828 [Oxalis oulophora]